MESIFILIPGFTTNEPRKENRPPPSRMSRLTRQHRNIHPQFRNRAVPFGVEIKRSSLFQTASYPIERISSPLPPNLNPRHHALQIRNHRVRMPERSHQIDQADDLAAVPLRRMQAQDAAIESFQHLWRDLPPQRHTNRLLRVTAPRAARLKSGAALEAAIEAAARGADAPARRGPNKARASCVIVYARCSKCSAPRR
jgi:hypothetical protein